MTDLDPADKLSVSQPAGGPVSAELPSLRGDLAALLKRAAVRPSGIGSLEDCKKLSVLMPRSLHRELKTFAFRHQTTITDLILALVVEMLALETEEDDMLDLAG